MSNHNEEKYKRRYEIFEEIIRELENSIDDDEFLSTELEIPLGEMKRREKAIEQFKVGNTPLIEVSGNEFGLERILIKDESKNHFGTFKDRKSLHVAELVYPYFERYVLAITSGNYGYSLSHFLNELDGNTILIVAEGLDEKKAGILREKSRLVPLNLDAKFYTSYELIQHVEDNLGLRGAEIIDASNFVISPYDSIFYELDRELIARNEKLDYLLVPLGCGELFLAALMHYRNPRHYRELIKGKKKIIGVTTNNPNSIAEMLYAKYRPVFYLGNDNESLEKQLRWIRESISRGKNKVEFRVMEANEDEIKRAYEFCQSRDLGAEESASTAFVPLLRYRFKPTDTIIVINTGDGRKNL